MRQVSRFGCKALRIPPTVYSGGLTSFCYLVIQNLAESFTSSDASKAGFLYYTLFSGTDNRAKAHAEFWQDT